MIAHVVISLVQLLFITGISIFLLLFQFIYVDKKFDLNFLDYKMLW